ncbi:MAG: CPBP family intramembrane metalloprotease, partial [Butyrivibrio sp.]|nr:CPBP family intramembrane metalloprotease [Butyrivibrio sp.]
GGILHFVLMFIVTMLLTTILKVLLSSFVPVDNSFVNILTIISCIIAYFISLWWFKPQLKNVIRMTDPGISIKVLIIFVVYWIVSVAIDLIAPEANYQIPSFTAITASLSAGIMEELLFRGFLLTPMLKKNVDRKRLITAAIVSAIIFGLFHGTNVFAGASLGKTISQVFTSFLLGLAFAAVYIMTGSLLPAIILHVIHDIIAYSNVAATSESGVMIGTFQPIDILGVVFAAILAFVIARLAFNKNRDAETIKLWNDTWSN